SISILNPPYPTKKSGAPKRLRFFWKSTSQQVNKLGLSGIRIIELSNYRDFGIRGGGGGMGIFGGKILWLGEK
ncbi:MAG: hypothetical protein SO115_02625, partial [Sodaliphilus sp.]|nr:hypothetical protein [Sodaliphilus sp.]